MLRKPVELAQIAPRCCRTYLESLEYMQYCKWSVERGAGGPRAGTAAGAAGAGRPHCRSATSHMPTQHELSWEQKVELYRDGFTVLRGAIAPPLVARARAAIDGTDATSVAPGEKPEFEQINLNKRAQKASVVGSDPEITDLLNKSAILPTLRAAIGDIAEQAGAQMALTMPTEPSDRCMQSGWPEKEIPHRGWAGHLDGVWNGGCPAPQAPSHPDHDPEFDSQLFADGVNGVNGCLRQVRKRSFCLLRCHFILQMILLTKTGSGQT